MFKNYLKVAYRNLLRYKGFSLINILSLAIGITGCFVIGLFVWDELKYDKSVEGGDNIYRLYDETNNNGNITHVPCVAPAYATFLQQQYPEVEATAKVLMSGDKYLVEVGEKKNYEEKGWLVDSSFFKIFPFKFIKGDPSTALSGPSSVVISEDIANRYFANEDPIDKIFTVDKDSLVVKGVMAKLPDHFHFDFQYLMCMPSAHLPAERMEKWTWHQF